MWFRLSIDPNPNAYRKKICVRFWRPALKERIIEWLSFTFLLYMALLPDNCILLKKHWVFILKKAKGTSKTKFKTVNYKFDSCVVTCIVLNWQMQCPSYPWQKILFCLSPKHVKHNVDSSANNTLLLLHGHRVSGSARLYFTNFHTLFRESDQFEL